MGNATQARPYATAAFDVAKKSNRVEEWTSALSVLKEALSFQKLQKFLTNPIISIDFKLETIEGLCREWMNEDIKRFIKLLLENNRLLAVDDIFNLFIQKKEAAARKISATFTAAFELTEKQQLSLVASIAQKTGLELVSTFLVDPDIIGGVIVRFNGNVIDISVRSQLAQLKHNLIR